MGSGVQLGCTCQGFFFYFVINFSQLPLLQLGCTLQVRGEDADDTSTYLVSFNDGKDARYLVFHLNKIVIMI